MTAGHSALCGSMMAKSTPLCILYIFFFSSRRRHTRWPRDWSSDVCSSDLPQMKFDWIDQVDSVSLLSARDGIGSSSATYVKDYCRCRREMPSENGLGPKSLELAPLVREPLRFLAL